MVKGLFNISLSSLNRNIFSGAVLSAMSIFLMLVSYPIYLTHLGAEGYGLWALFSVVISLSQVGELGINDALIKHVASSHNKEDYDSITAYSTTYLSIIFLFGFVLSLGIIYSRFFIVGWFDLGVESSIVAANLLQYVSLMIVPIFLSNTLKGVISGIGRIDYCNYIFMWLRVVQVVLSIILILLGFGLWGLLASNFIFFFLCYFLYHKFVISQGITYFRFSSFSFLKLKELFHLGSAVLFSRIAQKIFIDEMIKIIIAKYFGLAQLTYFEIAFKSIQSFRSIYVLSLRALISHVSMLNESIKQNKSQLHGLMMGIMKKIAYVTLPTSILLYFIFNDISQLWLGSAFNHQIVTNFQILLLGYSVNFLVIPIYNYFIGVGSRSFIIISTFISLSVFFVGATLNAVYFYQYGVNFIVITYACMITVNAFYLLNAYHKYNVSRV